jgi:hypothetical protein
MTYQIADQPHDSALRDYTVAPSAPLLAHMLCGAWLGWPWFAFNAFAMGSPTRRKELAVCAAGFLGTALLAAIVIALFDRGLLPEGAPIRIAVVAVTAYKMVVSYYLHQLQSTTFEIYRYYGGPVRNSRFVIIAGVVLRGTVLGLVDSDLWVIVVSGAL